MDDESPLAGLLDWAGKVFSLAGKLGRAFHEEHQGQGRQIDQAGWNRHTADFDEFCAALLDLRDAIQNPPEGFGPVAKPLLEASRIAKGIRDAMQRPEGRTWAAYLKFFPHLNSVCQDGWRAVKEVTKARRLDDPFAFVDAPAFSLLDRFPATPAGHVAFLEWVRDEVHSAAEAKQRQLERGYSNATIESMVRGIKWPEVRARLAALSNLPEGVKANAGDILRRELAAGTVEQIDALLGPAVRALRDAWEDHNASSRPIKAGEAFRRVMETDPETRAGWERARARLQTFAKAMQEAMDSPEYKAAQEAERQRWQELAETIQANLKWAGGELAARHFAPPESIEDWEHLARIVEIPAETIRTGNLTPREIFACALAWTDRQKIKAKLTAETNDAAPNESTAGGNATTKGDADASNYDVPQVDEYDNRVAWWIGKRIYLGNDTQIARLFWLLAKPVGRAHSLGDVQRAVEGMETSADAGSTPEEIEKAGKRLRKVVAKLRAALREAGLDDHVLIVKDGPQDEPQYSMVPRFGK
jgi:hypothetical protein